MSEQKFCKDCKFCQPAVYWWPYVGKVESWDYAKCTHGTAYVPATMSVVTGEVGEGDFLYCSISRISDNGCEGGKYFEAKAAHLTAESNPLNQVC